MPWQAPAKTKTQRPWPAVGAEAPGPRAHGGGCQIEIFLPFPPPSVVRRGDGRTWRLCLCHMLVELAAANPPTPHRTGKKRPPAPGNSAGLRGVVQWRVQLPVVISVVISDVANQKGKRPCPSFSGDHHPQQVVGSSSKNAHGERLSFGSVVNPTYAESVD